MTSPILRRAFLSLLAFACLAAGAFAQDLGGLRQRMSERLPALDRLKSEGVIGETNDGYVVVRGGGGTEAAKLVEAENTDRKAVYAAIARNTGAQPEAVAKARARQIAAGSAPGVWLQNEQGEWYRK